MDRAVAAEVKAVHVRGETPEGIPSEVTFSIPIIQPTNPLEITKATSIILTVLTGGQGWTTFPGNQIPRMRNTLPKVSEVIPISFQFYLTILHQRPCADLHPSELHPGQFSPQSSRHPESEFPDLQQLPDNVRPTHDSYRLPQ